MSVRRVSAELESIQALRAIAATSVILVHIPFIGKGAFGVDIFFVISGFIICYISSLLLGSVIAITACFLLAIASFRTVERTSNEFLRWRFIKHRPRVSAEASRSLNSIRAT